MKTYFNTITLAAHIGASVAALVVAFGASIGFYDMTGSMPIAVLGGVGIASILAIGWYTLITLGSRARRGAAKGAVVALGAVLVLAALGTSGWALATAIGGKQALAAYQSRSLAEHEIALAAAMSRVNAQIDFVDIVSQHAVATGLLGDEEGRSGRGPLFRSYERTQESLNNAAQGMTVKLEDGETIYRFGIADLDKASAALGTPVFRLHMTNVESAIAELNAIDVSDDVKNIGMVGLNDKGLPELDGLTSSLRSASDIAVGAPVAIPRYVPMTRSDAVLSERPAGAWIAAFAIDFAPLILLLIVMIAAGEPLLREDRKVKGRKTDESIREDELEVSGLRSVT